MVSGACVGVRISMMFHLMFVHNTFSSVWVVGHLLGNSCPLGLQSVLIVLFSINNINLLAHLSRNLKGELIVYPCSGVRRCRRRRRCRCQPFSNNNISEASRPIQSNFI